MRNMRNRDSNERMRAFAPVWRVALGLMALAVAVLPPRVTAQMNTTTVQGTIYRADGTAASGTLLVSWPAFTTPQNQAVAAGNVSTMIGADGFVSLNLAPNAAALPTGSYYTAVYHLSDGTVNQEYWVVPASATASVASVRAQLEPSTIAVQPVSQAYVNSAIQSLTGSWLSLTGGTMSGPLTLNADPTAANQATTKHYADQLAAAELPLSGGTLTGPVGGTSGQFSSAVSWGANCPAGVTDSSTCLNAAASVSTDIKLGPGTWNLASEWLIPTAGGDQYRICGSGPSTILNITGTNGGVHITGTAGATSSKTLLCDMTIQSSSATATFGVHLDGIANFHVQNVNVQLAGSGVLTNGYQLTGAQQGKIDASTIIANAGGGTITNLFKFEASGLVHSNGVEVDGNWLFPNGGTAVNVSNTDDLFFHSNHIVFTAPAGTCISDTGGGYGVINFYDNHCEGYATGFVLGGDDSVMYNSFYPSASGVDGVVTGVARITGNLLQKPVTYQSGSSGLFNDNIMVLGARLVDNNPGGNTIVRCNNYFEPGTGVIPSCNSQIGGVITSVFSAGGVSGVTGTGGTGMTVGTYALSFSGGGGSGAAGTLTVLTATTFSVALTAAGDGYTLAPAVTAATGGTPPTLTATVTPISGSGTMVDFEPYVGGPSGIKVNSTGVGADAYLQLHDVILAGNTNGGALTVKSGVGGTTWGTFSGTGLSVPGLVRAQTGVTGATINGEITVDGVTYTTLNAAWSAAVSQANASRQNQTVRLGPGTFNVTATLAEPTNGACVSLIGSAAPTVTADNTNASTVINVPSSLGGDLFGLQNTTGAQAQSCTFRDLLIMANGNANHAFNFQWFRGLYVDEVTVNDTTQDAFYLGESSGTHQANFEMRDVTVSYSASSFTPASRPNYGLNLQATVLDSFVQNLLVRNALQAAVYNAGGGTTFELIHGFGYPYTCATAPCNNTTETNSSAADASWATNYEVIDAGSGGNMYFNTYMDSPAIAAFDLKSNGVQINGGHIQWPDTTSFPDATFAKVEAAVTSNMVISNVDCLNMSTTAGVPGSPSGATGVWISYMGANGVAPSYSSVSNLAGCGQYVQQRVAARQTAFDMTGNNSSNTNYGAGQPGVTPKVFVTPLSTQGNEGGVEVENFSGGQGDSFYSGISGQASNFAVMADGTVKHTGVQTNAVFATGPTTLTKANHIVLANASSGAFTLTLPSCYTAMPDGLAPTGMEFTIIKTDTSSNAVQVATSSAETINVLGSGSTSYSIIAAGGLTLACGPDSNWYSTEQIAAAPSSSGIASFDGRTGAVSPASGDYSFGQISGQVANSQLPATLTASTTGNAATATALQSTPSQCPTGYYAAGIQANGTPNCLQSWHFTWHGSFAGTFGTSTNTSMGAIWSPTASINMTRLDIAVGTAPAGCTTYPVIGVYDSTAATWLKTVTLAPGTYSYRNAVSGVSIVADHNLSMGVQTAAAGCTTNAGSAQLTMEYTMNQ